jgi:hypothetical protein
MRMRFSRAWSLSILACLSLSNQVSAHDYMFEKSQAIAKMNRAELERRESELDRSLANASKFPFVYKFEPILRGQEIVLIALRAHLRDTWKVHETITPAPDADPLNPIRVWEITPRADDEKKSAAAIEPQRAKLIILSES